jgi:hypothetical protein
MADAIGLARLYGDNICQLTGTNTKAWGPLIETYAN